MPIISADIIRPTVTNVFFEKNGVAYNDSVTFNVGCYGYTFYGARPGFEVKKEPGTYTPEIVFSFKASIKNYGDSIYEPYYMNYRHIDYCNIEGNTKEGNFSIKNFSNSPVNFSLCGDTEEKHIVNGRENEFYRKCSLRVNLNQQSPAINDTIAPAPKIKRNFFSSISCFFRNIFGKKCE